MVPKANLNTQHTKKKKYYATFKTGHKFALAMAVEHLAVQ
jgi:hypothetical protein